jgi:hypothetical protein
MIAYFARSPRWREVGARKSQLHTGKRDTGLRGGMRERELMPRTLGTRSFEYTPPTP